MDSQNEKNKQTAQCTLCQKEIDLSTKESATLDLHAVGKQKTAEISDCYQGLYKYLKKQESNLERITVKVTLHAISKEKFASK